jgi:WD repeat-containing protein 68
MPGFSPIDHHPISPRDPPFAPHRPPTLTFDHSPSSASGATGATYHQNSHHPSQLSPLHPPHPSQSANSVPNVLQPAGGTSPRPHPISSNTEPTIPTIQPPQPAPTQHYQQSLAAAASPRSSNTPPKTSLDINMAHSYSRSSPGAGYDGSSSAYHSYTPTTPGGGPSSANHFMSPSEMKYNAPGSQRNISNTPLGLADIRPRADSSMSDSGPAALGYDIAHTQPGTSNYLAPWAIYAFDWCKWAPQGNGAGKLAVGSYLEDGHNFVSPRDIPRRRRRVTKL